MFIRPHSKSNLLRQEIKAHEVYVLLQNMEASCDSKNNWIQLNCREIFNYFRNLNPNGLVTFKDVVSFLKTNYLGYTIAAFMNVTINDTGFADLVCDRLLKGEKKPKISLLK